MDTSAVTDRTLQGMAPVRCNPAAAATIDLRMIVTASAVQLDPAHEADARFFESDRGCWKAGLRSAGLTNACGRRPSAPLRKVIESPVQCGSQAGCRVFLRHISIMRLLSLGYEPPDTRLRRLWWSLVAVLTSADRPACAQVSRCIGLSGSNRVSPALTGRSDTQRARHVRSRSPRPAQSRVLFEGS
jgi:hypothetical protein